jgi:hypothetical protein
VPRQPRWRPRLPAGRAGGGARSRHPRTAGPSGAGAPARPGPPPRAGSRSGSASAARGRGSSAGAAAAPAPARPAAAPPDVPCSPPHVLVGRATHSQLCRPKKMIGSRSAELGDRRPAAAETGWMAAAETRVPDTTKALAEWEACMDGAAAGHG